MNTTLEQKISALEATLSNVSSLYQIGNAFAVIEDRKILYRTLLDQVGRCLGADIGIIYSVDVKTYTYQTLYVLGIQEGERSKMFGSLDKTLLEAIYKEPKIISVYAQQDGAMAVQHPILGRYHPKASLTAFIEEREGSCTFLQFMRCSNEAFTPEDERMIRIFLDKTVSVLKSITIQEKLKAETGETGRLNKLMLGRELKMVELKQENARLRAELEAKNPQSL